jgi:Beta protein
VHPDDIAVALREMGAVGQWRCLVVIGTSIPTTLSCVKEGTVGAIRRREWDLWSGLAQCELPRMPAFGDYAIQHPEPPKDDVAGNTMRANIRYTAATETIVARGRGPVSQEGNEQYRDLCKQLVARSEFAGAAYSWGDTVIEECANGLREPGSQNLWRGAGTSHHVQLVTDRVRELQAQSQIGV